MLRKICIHWTAGTYNRSNADFEHYHFTVGEDGSIPHGRFSPLANVPPLGNGKYAEHCGGGNSYCIGIALRGMAGYESPGNAGEYPLTQKQCESAWAFIAKLCKQYGISVAPDTVFTHYEFGKRNPHTSSRGKIDITHLPYEPHLKADEVGDYIRTKVRWYLQRLDGAH